MELTLQGLGWYQFPFCEFKMHDIAVKYDWWYQQNSNSQPLGLKSALYQFCQGSNSLGQSVITDWPKELLIDPKNYFPDNSLGQSVITDWPKELLPWQN